MSQRSAPPLDVDLGPIPTSIGDSPDRPRRVALRQAPDVVHAKAKQSCGQLRGNVVRHLGHGSVNSSLSGGDMTVLLSDDLGPVGYRPLQRGDARAWAASRTARARWAAESSGRTGIVASSLRPREWASTDGVPLSGL